MPTMQLSSTLRQPLTEVLVVHCSDYRFQSGYQEFLNHNLGLNGNYDLIVIPGGPQSLTLVEYLPKFSWAGWKWLEFLADAHNLKRLILFQHQDCKWYGTVPVHLHSSSELRQRQEEDLRRVKAVVSERRPELRLDLYYAGWDASEHITIESVTG